MITLYHSPQTRSSTVLSLLHSMDLLGAVTVKTVTTKRSDGSGAADPANPHPEGKVPLLDTGDALIRERGAIILWLTDHFDHELGRGVDHPSRAAYLSWLFYYGYVMEPTLVMRLFEMGDHPGVQSWIRGWPEVLEALDKALQGNDYLLDDEISAADVLMASPFMWLPGLDHGTQAVKDWIERVRGFEDQEFLAKTEAKQMADLGLSNP